ncbi:MAG TPA: 1,4-alpha-glucan branching enzyme, partial [Opitutaceae bacterium]|nr:1,4-alpha-glucan branching enzyme [Opitutaceae bacterium]
MHLHKKGRSQGVVVRAFLRDATDCAVTEASGAQSWPMTRLDVSGFFEVFIPKRPGVFRYRLKATRGSGETHQFFDPYSFLPTLSDQDLYLFN